MNELETLCARLALFSPRCIDIIKYTYFLKSCHTERKNKDLINIVFDGASAVVLRAEGETEVQ